MSFLTVKMGGSATLAFAILSLAQPASAVIYNWQFTNEDGNFGNPTDVVAGFVEFSSYTTYAEIANQEAIAADNLQITSVTGLTEATAPFFGDSNIELNENLVLLSSGSIGVNSFYFDSLGEIRLFDPTGPSAFYTRSEETFGGVVEEFSLDASELGDSFLGSEESAGGTIRLIRDQDSSSIQFSQSGTASVPFEFSPTLGLLLVGSILAGKSYIKRRQACSFTNSTN